MGACRRALTTQVVSLKKENKRLAVELAAMAADAAAVAQERDEAIEAAQVRGAPGPIPPSAHSIQVGRGGKTQDGRRVDAAHACRGRACCPVGLGATAPLHSGWP